MAKYARIYDLNIDNADEQYEQRSNIAVCATYCDGGSADTVMYELNALTSNGEETNWEVGDYLRYWIERRDFWQKKVNGGDNAGSKDIVNAWMRERSFACCIELKVA